MNTQAPDAPGLLLHLGGPLQAWGTRSHYSERDTASHPTRSGIIGLLAACLGRARHDPIDDLARLSLTTRTDRPGTLLRDLHTVGGGLPAKHTVTTAEGKKRPPAQGTLLSHRSYLADAAFTACLTGDQQTLLTCHEALLAPRWPPFLGRRSCPPEGPLLIGLWTHPLHHLVHLPLARAHTGHPVRIPFHADTPLERLAASAPGPQALNGATPSGHINDEPHHIPGRQRAYRTRDLYQRTLTFPADRCAGLGPSYLDALITYRTHAPQGAA